MINGELIIDCFAGGGGTSVGIEMATGSSPDIAVNHSPAAVRMHAANHPATQHYCEDIWRLRITPSGGRDDPAAVCNGKPIALAWFSPDCTHFSRSRGGKPKSKAIRGLAWSACRWAALVSPRVIILENVEEFMTWGPLNRRHHPVRAKQGATFRKFISQMEGLGYIVEYRTLSAADYGTPTARKRFFLIARRDGKPIIWPEPTHGPAGSPEVKEGKRLPYIGAHTQVDFSLLCPSIFATAESIREKYGIRATRPLVPKTLQRIAKGIEKFVAGNPDPFLVQLTENGKCRDSKGMEDGLYAAFIVQQQGMSVGSDIRSPLNTITAGGMGHMYLVMIHLHHADRREAMARLEAAGAGQGEKRGEGDGELDGVYRGSGIFPETVEIHGTRYRIADIGLRILEPRELYGCQGFPKNYIIDRDSSGKAYPKSEQVRRCGNAVCPPVPEALIRANLPELCAGAGKKAAQPAA